MRYRRFYQTGGTYFFTVVTDKRQKILTDETDFIHHFNYLHFNPVKHGYVEQVSDWPFSTFHRYVKQGIYPKHWGGSNVDFSIKYDG